MKENLVFFLGGHDAEMFTIKELLTNSNIPKENIFDNNLKWGARLSEYKDELSKLSVEQVPVFVELNLDIDYPSNELIIDHHNERAGADRKTSIEQIADLLGIELNRWQQLISANDKGYIWALNDLGATEEEIKKIGSLDMQEQGITKEDFEKAEISVNHFLERISKDMVIIHSLIENTSPITDLIYKYYRHIFIITPSQKLNYSGNGQIVKLLENKYSEMKKEDSKIESWSGGSLPDHGFFGSNKSLTKKEIVEIMEPFIEKERIHSQHIFMFPFLIDIRQKNKSKEHVAFSSSEELLKHIFEHIRKHKECGWKYKPFQISLIDKKKESDKKFFSEDGKRIIPYSPDETWAYNEYNYFYECVREALFNQIDEKDVVRVKESPVSLYYERDVLPTDEMSIYIKGRPDPLKLSVNHLSLRIFETGIGILSITLYNYCTTDFNDVLLINDFGRRIYPQFLGGQQDNPRFPGGSKMPVDFTKEAFLAEEISFSINGIPYKEDFPTGKYLNMKDRFALYLEELLKPLHNPVELKGDKNSENKAWTVKPIIDDRMYTICWHENKAKTDILKKYDGQKYSYEDNDDWYKYIFLDSGKNPLVQHINFKKELIKESTYRRFVDWGTFYGITRYSFMCLCGIDEENDTPYKLMRNHMQKMYFQMCVLLLAQRASIIKFNNDLEQISEDADRYFRKHKKGIKKNIDSTEILDRAEQLDKDVILFSSRIWFDEVTPQEQGIELYTLAHKNMNTENQLISLREKIRELHDFITMKLEQNKTTSILQLTKMSTYFVPLMVVLTFWCMDFYFTKFWRGDERTTYSVNEFLTVSFAGFIASIIIVFFSFMLFKDFSLSLFKRKNLSLRKLGHLVIWFLGILVGILILWIFFSSYHK